MGNQMKPLLLLLLLPLSGCTTAQRIAMADGWNQAHAQESAYAAQDDNYSQTNQLALQQEQLEHIKREQGWQDLEIQQLREREQWASHESNFGPPELNLGR